MQFTGLIFRRPAQHSIRTRRPELHRGRLFRARLFGEYLEDRCLLAANQFAVIGDYGSAGPNEAAVAALVKSWNPGFVITVGDNNYDVGSAATIDANIGQYYREFIGNYTGAYGPGSATNRFFPALGNHDWGTPGAAPYLNYFTLPGNERYYDYVQGPIHFFVVDSDPAEPDGRNSSSTQARWLQAGLAASTAPFQLVYFHHAPYSSGNHGSDVTMQWPFQQWGADAVLAGHDHTYERLNIGGLPYFVNGLGGRSLYPFGAPVAGSQFRYSANYGAMLVTYDNASVNFEFHSITGGDTLIDSYTLSSAPTTTETVVPTGAVWSYLANGSNQGTAWKELTFDDNTWNTGAAQLGYGDGDEATVVSYGADAANKYITTYFRREFSVSDPTKYSSLTLNLLRDDGAVVYLNGQEIARSNMPSGTITSSTLAPIAVGGAEETAFFSFNVNPALLQTNNVLAVEIHQANGTSTDVSFDLSLVGTVATTPTGPTLSVTDTTVNEGNSGTLSAVFTVNLSAASTQAVTVSVSTANGSATADGDYLSQTTTLTFAPGATARTLTVSVNGDTIDEANEDFFVNLSSPAGATIADSQGKGTIVDDDAPPTIAISDASVVEGNSGPQFAVFTVSLSQASAQAISFSFSTASGTASAGKDYTAIAATRLTFAAGEISKTITVQVKSDKTVEDNETFFINLSNAIGATISDAQGIGTILNDDVRRNGAAASARQASVAAALEQLDNNELAAAGLWED
jgi:hypothetical protein